MQVLLGILGILLICVVPFVAVSAAFAAVKWVLGPLDRAAKNRNYPIQFSLADFLCLFVQVQLVLAWPAQLFRQTPNEKTVGALAIIIAILMGLVLLVWWTGVRTLSRAGVHGTLARAFTLTVSIPFGYTFSIAVPMLPFGIFASLTDWPAPRLAQAGLFFLAELAVILVVVGLGFMTRRILATAQRQRDATTRKEPAPPT
jgi:hypothetical protein